MAFTHKVYADGPHDVTPAVLDDQTLAEIGRLVRACAEIEDLVTFFICTLAEISETRATVLLGKIGITQRIQIARYLAQLSGDKAVSVCNDAFDADFQAILDCRNAVAHGVFLGTVEEGRLAFLTRKTVRPETDAARQVVEAYAPVNIALYARTAEGAIPKLEAHLQVKELRRDRYLKPLSGHPKAKAQT
jgi:hypothetical protein